ncbi:translocating chain-associated membrane protein 1-like 1 isoform X6 [Oncorhynchus tshawytscha]|uniref:translocating chain-associated membrane protein 1-like 1 isoform X6 n=1 Tax=Oncorhynchus tshawytscha TaxID=74940 RepID=UPI001C3E76CE|nr:translocating chain-associated membrane protein 1-like 1 isoform X6 [Oncorhynchus tshawytscha]
MGFRKKNKSPPVLSHEFVIQNHADMVSCVAMIILLGLMFEVTAKFAIMFITIQYNVTQSLDERAEQVNLYQYGPKDIATVFFYLLIAVILHALIQEYILDKMNRRLHLSKTKHSKFNESGQLAAFYLLSFIWGCSILTAEEFATNPTFLWEGYPHTHMVPDLCLPVTCPLCSFQVKFFYICQIAYWLHALPELYFQKVRKEDIPRQLYYICLYVFHITGAYILNFTLWALLFVIARLLTLTLSVLTFGFGLPRAENQGFSLAKGNFNVLTIRMTCLAAICLTQAWMMWKFINFQLKKWREHSQSQASKKKAFSPKSKPHKKDLARVGSANGVVKSDDKASPRARKAKAS